MWCIMHKYKTKKITNIQKKITKVKTVTAGQIKWETFYKPCIIYIS